MGGYRRPGPLCGTKDGFNLGTLALIVHTDSLTPLRGLIYYSNLISTIGQCQSRLRGGLFVEKIEADETDMKIQRFHLIAAMAS